MSQLLTRRRARITALALLTGAILAGCSDIAERLQADVVAVNLLLETGDPFGLVPRKAGVLINLASITGPLNDPSTSPVSGANVTMTASTGASGTVTLPEDGAGIYRATSGSAGAATFVYTSNATYSVSMVIPSGELADTYTTAVVAPPRTEVTGLPDTLGGATIPVGADLALTLVGSYDRGIVVVVDQTGTVLYDNRPVTPQEWVDFTLGNFDGTLTIPGATFSQADTAYGVVIAGLESAQPSGISTNLQILTRFYAGSAKTALVRTAP